MGNRLGCVIRQYGHHCVRLDLAGCRWLQVTGLEDIGRCRRLEVLDMTGCSAYRVDLLGHVVRHCRQLRALLVSGCTEISRPQIIQELFDTPAHHRLDLEVLDMRGVRFGEEAAPARRRPAAEEGVLDAVLERLIRGGGAGDGAGAARLRVLRLGWRGEASGEPYMYNTELEPLLPLLARWGPGITVLDLPGWFLRTVGLGGEASVAAAALAGAFARLTSLRVLNISNSNAHGAALRALPTASLRHLNLRGNRLIADEDLAPLLHRNPGLRAINAGCCKRLTDATLRQLAACCPGLTSLDLCFATGMTAEAVLLAAASFPGLVEFGFSGFPALRDADVEAIAARLPRLRLLGFMAIPSLTDAALRSVAAHCGPTLEVLFCGELPRVTAQALHDLLARCPRLRSLSAEGCGRLGEAEAAALQGRFPAAFDGDLLPEGLVREESGLPGR